MIKLPTYFSKLIAGSKYEGPIGIINAAVSNILTNNAMPFFPAYTDHGISHVEHVLEVETKLIPEDIKTASILTSADIVTLVVSTMLHDIGMYISEIGFINLITQFMTKPQITWFPSKFNEQNWSKEWSDFIKEARRFSDTDLSMLFGPIDYPKGHLSRIRDLPDDISDWNTYDRLLIGEFIRRHHHRLAHEIVVCGFPGLSEKLFPKISDLLPDLDDLVGVIARSHGIDIRTANDYIQYKYRNNLRPFDTVPLFLMALLRISDYLQIDSHRAPPVLLQLKNPQSPLSLSEWKKQQAVAHISFTDKDPMAINIQINSTHSLRTHLQLRELIPALQKELDFSNAVLAEVYGRTSNECLNKLLLSKSRVFTNLNSHALNSTLPYVPEEIVFKAHPHLLFLLVEPLYGANPAYGIRELLQNSIDAVRERYQVCSTNYCGLQSQSFRNEHCDILIKICRTDHSYKLVVSDNGIGMDLPTIKNHFLKAGSSLRNCPEWRKQFIGDDGNCVVARSGRFGIGIFASFLLGATIEVETRHLLDNSGFGYCFTASNNSDLIEITQKAMPYGTILSIPLSKELALSLVEQIRSEGANIEIDEDGNYSLKDFFDDDEEEDFYKDFEYQEDSESVDDLGISGDSKNLKYWNWYTFDWPKIFYCVESDRSKEFFIQEYLVPSERTCDLPPDWHSINSHGFVEIRWTAGFYPALTCNGLFITNDLDVSWCPHELERNFRAPSIAIIDSEANTPINLTRTALSRNRLEFDVQVFDDITLDYLAFILTIAPPFSIWDKEVNLNAYRTLYPLDQGRLLDLFSGRSVYDTHYSELAFPILFRELGWICNSEGVAPLNPSILSINKIDRILLFGTPGRQIWAPKLSGELGYVGIPTFIARTIISSLLDSFVEFVKGDVNRYFGSVKGARLYIVSDSSSLMPSSDYAKESQPIYEHRGRYVHRFTIGECQRSNVFIDYKSIIEDTWRKGLNAFIAELYVQNHGVIDGLGSFGEMWLKFVGNRFIPFNIRDRFGLVEKCNEYAPLRSHIEKWKQYKVTKIFSIPKEIDKMSEYIYSDLDDEDMFN